MEVRGNVIKSPLSADQALVMCRSMAKEVYSVFFDFIVSSVNEKIKFDHENKVWIGVSFTAFLKGLVSSGFADSRM